MGKKKKYQTDVVEVEEQLQDNPQEPLEQEYLQQEEQAVKVLFLYDTLHGKMYKKGIHKVSMSEYKVLLDSRVTFELV